MNVNDDDNSVFVIPHFSTVGRMTNWHSFYQSTQHSTSQAPDLSVSGSSSMQGYQLQSNIAVSPGKHVCNKCGKVLLGHVRRHQANCQMVTLFPCELCDRTYTRKDNMHSHMKYAHGIDKKERQRYN